MNELSGIAANTDIMSIYRKTNNIVDDMRQIIDESQKRAYQAVDFRLIQRNWLIGYRIAEEELNGEERAEYGARIIKELSKELTNIYGKGFTKTNLYSFYSFYKCFPEIFHTLCGKSEPKYLLTWSHLYSQMLCADRFKNKKDNPSGCRSDGYVYSDV